MSDLSTFAELMQKAAKDKAERIAAENARREKEVAPLLSELFKTVKTAKDVANKDVVEKKEKIVDLVKSLETQVEEASRPTKEAKTKENDTDVAANDENSVMRVIKQLQKDFATLKNYVESNKQVSSMSFGGGGSGEVRITRMDDVEKATPKNGDTLVWDASIKQFIYAPAGATGTPEEEMPYAKRVDFISDNIIYKGEAAVGSFDSDPVWRIHRLTLAPDGDMIEMWASGDSSFSYSWSDRLTYPYQ
jgi:hypothetical protein